MKTKLRSHHHCVYKLKYHLVLVSKYRKKCFSKEILSRLEEILNNLAEKWDIELLEFGGEEDHIHLLLSMHPNVTPSKFINNIKTVTSRLIRKEFSEHLARFYWKPVMWTRAYCLITAGGAPLDVLKQYIESQGDKDKNSSPPKLTL
jgi:putative transposase